MRTVHNPNDQIRFDSRPARCLRHHVWMAACTDCRDARAQRRDARRERGAEAA